MAQDRQTTAAPDTPPASNLTITASTRQQERTSDVVRTFAENADGLTKLVGAVGTEIGKARTAAAGVSTTLAALTFAWMTVIVLGLGALVWVGRLEGSTLTLIVGVVVGYSIRFVESLGRDGTGGDK